MPPVKTVKVMTSAGTSTPNPAGAGDLPVVDPPAPGEVPEVQAIPPSAPSPTAPGTPTEEAPNRPGLETAPPAAVGADPFVLLQKWGNVSVARTLRALPIPGGCIVRLSAQFGVGATMTETLCFVPGVKIENGALIKE